jgi:serine/threonine-protein kinase
MGAVFEAENTRIKHRVAIKMLLPHTADSEEMIERFHREARAAGQLRSSHVARVFDSDVTPDGLHYMVLEFLEGADLSALAKARGKLPYAEAASYVLQACVGMAEAHRAGIVHRDLKLSNLFLSDAEGRQTIKVLDFGISKVMVDDKEENHLTATATIVGTPHFMAPEQIQNSRGVDERADIWSLGVILYRLLTGRLPFEGNALSVAGAILSGSPTPVRHVCDDVPDALSFAVSRALRRDPALRFQTTAAFARALMPFAECAEAAQSHPSLLMAKAAPNEELPEPATDDVPLGPDDEADSLLRLPDSGIEGAVAGPDDETREAPSGPRRAAAAISHGSHRAFVLEQHVIRADEATKVTRNEDATEIAEPPSAVLARPHPRRPVARGVAILLVAVAAVALWSWKSSTTSPASLASPAVGATETAPPTTIPEPQNAPSDVPASASNKTAIAPPAAPTEPASATSSPTHAPRVDTAPAAARPRGPAGAHPQNPGAVPRPPPPETVKGGDEHVLHL